MNKKGASKGRISIIAEVEDEDDDNAVANIPVDIAQSKYLSKYIENEDKIAKENARDRKKWTEIINRLSKNNDGKVTYEEFRDGMMDYFNRSMDTVTKLHAIKKKQTE